MICPRPTPQPKKKKDLFPWAPVALASFWSQNMMHLCLGSPASKASVPDLLGTQVLGWWLICGEMVPSCLCVCVCVCVRAHTCAKSLQSCLSFYNPMDYSLPGSSVHGIFQARIMEWVAMPSSRGIFPAQRSNLCLLGLLPWWGFYHSHCLGSPRCSPPHTKSLCIRGIRCRLTRSDVQLRMFIQNQWTYKLSERA